MRRRTLILGIGTFILALNSLTSAEATGDIDIPDTPAGKRFAAWLSAYNTGKREALSSFFVENAEKAVPVEELSDSHSRLYVNDGPVEVEGILSSSPTLITALVRAKSTAFWLQITVAVSDTDPHLLNGFRYRHIAIPAEKLPKKKLTEPEIGRRIDTLLDRLVAADNFSGVILVAKEGKQFYKRASGMANRAWNAPLRTDTKLNIASLSKMFTAVAIAQLVEQGKLSFDTTVADILPDYPNPEAARKITVHHLLTHTAGLASRSLGEFRKGYRSLKEYLPSFANAPQLFEPGERYEYSNDGYLLLGLLIEKVSGQDYYTYIRDHIYKPASMTHSDSVELDTNPVNLGEGYMDGPNGTRRNNIFALPIKGLPYGLGYATVEDLMRFATALTKHTLLSAKTISTIWTGKVQSMPGMEYGYGFDLETYNSTRIVGHSGGWAGITNQMDIYPDLGYTVVILTNIDDSPRPIAYKIREWLIQGSL